MQTKRKITQFAATTAFLFGAAIAGASGASAMHLPADIPVVTAPGGASKAGNPAETPCATCAGE